MRTSHLFSVLFLGIAALASSASNLAAQGSVDFARDVLPILSDNCFQCHGPDAKEGRKGDLRLDDEADLKRARDGYHVVVPGDPASSRLLQRVSATSADERMPPPELGRSLSPEQITTLQTWISEGATWGKHWAFERVTRPTVEASDRHPIDVLIERTLEREGGSLGVKPTPQASPETRLRRLKLDLTGLPPTLTQIDQFLADGRADAWERVVDETLNTSAFGERMAWDWLEAARYADSNGYQGDNDRSMWPWRDWVVRAFNENLPFDQFTIWQLAGDLLTDATHDQILATGFNRNHMINGEGGRIAEENRVDYVMDMAETMGTVWLGLTLNCCRCHDHKFDPLKQREYYQITAFFNQTPVNGGGGNPQTPPILESPPPSERAKLAEAKARWQAADAALRKASESGAIEATSLPNAVAEAHKKSPESRKAEDWDRLQKHFAESRPEYAAFLKEGKAAKDHLDQLRRRAPKVMVMQDQDKLRPTYILNRGLYNQREEEVDAGVPSALPSLTDPANANRLDLARWLVSRENPLTARVTVNRFWQMLFGIGLVKTAEDFGVQAEYPVHRELLDWLAAELMESEWDVKHLLHLIVTSDAYQRSSVIDSPEARERDPENRLLARGPRFRMPSWMIRDQALAAAGLLHRKLGGPSVYTYQPTGVWAEATFGKKRYPQGEGANLHRRSLYAFWRRIVGPTVFFDTAKRQVCEVKPLRTNTPMHALTTLNDVTYVEAARVLAADVLQDSRVTSLHARLDLVSRRVLGRRLAVSERAIWDRTLQRATEAFSADPEAAEKFRSHGAAPQSPDLPAATHAAWTAVCLNFFNLDEALTKE